jgi:hypothetical protein
MTVQLDRLALKVLLVCKDLQVLEQPVLQAHKVLRVMMV